MAEKQPLTNGSYGATTKPPTPTGAHSMDLLRTSSSKNPINTSSNVLLLYRMNELQHLGRVNFGLAVGTLLYLATNVVLFTFNAMCAAASESPVPSLVEAPRHRRDADAGTATTTRAATPKASSTRAAGRPCLRSSSTSTSSGRGSSSRASRRRR